MSHLQDSLTPKKSSLHCLSGRVLRQHISSFRDYEFSICQPHQIQRSPEQCLRLCYLFWQGHPANVREQVARDTGLFDKRIKRWEITSAFLKWQIKTHQCYCNLLKQPSTRRFPEKFCNQGSVLNDAPESNFATFRYDWRLHGHYLKPKKAKPRDSSLCATAQTRHTGHEASVV